MSLTLINLNYHFLNLLWCRGKVILEQKLNAMKHFGNTLLFCFLAATANAGGQQAENSGSGKITYEEKIKLEIKLEGDGAQFASMLPKERKAEKILTFSPEATLFEDGNNNAEEMISSEGSHEGGVRIRMVASGENKTYTDLKKNTVTEQRDFMNRIFLVEKPVPAAEWKISGNQKEILGYLCFEASRTDTAGVKTVVWFTPSIAVKSGPAGLGNLPGIILEADISDGSRVYTAKSIEKIAQGDLKMDRPKEGKKVTEEEYKALVAEKMKEMGIENGGGGSGTHMNIVIKRQ